MRWKFKKTYFFQIFNREAVAVLKTTLYVCMFIMPHFSKKIVTICDVCSILFGEKCVYLFYQNVNKLFHHILNQTCPNWIKLVQIG